MKNFASVSKTIILTTLFSFPAMAFAVSGGAGNEQSLAPSNEATTMEMANGSYQESMLVAVPGGGGSNVPLDGGLSLLIAAGAGLGVKKYKEHKASKNA